VALVCALASVARADVRAGDDKFLHGDYAQAVDAYKAVKGKDGARAQVRLARVLQTVGDLAGARAAAEAAATGKGGATEARVLLAELDRAGGKYAEARALLEDVLKKEPKQLRARVQLGLVYRETGQKAAEAKVWNGIFDEHDAGKLDESKAETLLYLATAAR